MRKNAVFYKSAISTKNVAKFDGFDGDLRCAHVLKK